jgi:hypothetical protein
VNNGKPTAWWSESAGAASTRIEVVSPLPTVYYNCYYAGSLCKNLELTQTGAFAGTIDMELVYDKDSDRRDARRKKICPGNWNQRHACPETDQPDVFVRDIARNPRADALPNKISSSLEYPMGRNGRNDYLIAGFLNTLRKNISPSGLMYTCDEFPFAR